jgi:hypothetical protein
MHTITGNSGARGGFVAQASYQPISDLRKRQDMEDQEYRSILKRTGAIVVAIGLADIAAMIYCVTHQISYFSSVNIFAVIAGVFLIRGSLKAATIVRWFAIFLTSAFLVGAVAYSITLPFDLIRAKFRLEPLYPIALIGLMLLLLLLSWISRELGREQVEAACIAGGRQKFKARIPAAAGVGLVLLLTVFDTGTTRGRNG